MAERAKRNLPYGHFGEAIYSLEDDEWAFERSLRAARYLRRHGPSRTIQSPHIKHRSEDCPVRKEPPMRRMRKQAKALIDRFPELQPAAALFPDLLRISEAVEEAASRHGRIGGRLIALSNIRSEVQHKTIKIVALPFGETRSRLRVMRVQNQRRGFSDDKAQWIDVPILHGEEAISDALGGRIEQVTFAQPVDRGEPLLGVRLSSKTLIFRPTHGLSKRSTSESLSNIQLNLMYAEDIHGLGGSPHADIAFNPWFSQQVAIVGQSGMWIVMEFHSRRLSAVARAWRGTVSPSALSDGWLRIAWLLNLETIVVCTRNTMTLFNIAGVNSVHICTVAPEIHSGPKWILDFAVLPGQLDECVLLTTGHILFYKVSSSGLRELKIQVSTSIEHFRNPEDINLRMKVWHSDDNILVLLYSSSVDTGTVYTFSRTARGELNLEEPIVLQLLEAGETRTIADLHVAPVSQATTAEHTEAGVLDEGRFLQMTIMLSDNTTIEQLLCCSTSRTDGANIKVSWQSRLNATGAKIEHEACSGGDDLDLSTLAEHRPRPDRSRRARRSRNCALASHRAVHLSRLAKKLVILSPPPPAAAVIDSAKARFHADDDTILPMQTLYNLRPSQSVPFDRKVVVESLDDVQALLSEPLMVQGIADDTSSRARRLETVFVLIPSEMHFPPELVERSLTSTYNTIVGDWLSGLSDDIPGRIRLAKAALAQEVTVQLALANRIVHIDDNEPHEPPDGIEEQNSELPHAAAQQESAQFSALPTPSPSATPSVVTMSTGVSSFAAPELFRLCRYTSFSKPSPSVLSRPMSRIMSHWGLGESTAGYDWQSTYNSMQREDEEEAEGQEMTEKERLRLQRRAERHIRRQRKEAEASQAHQMASSQAPEIFTASQPIPTIVESQPVMASSQPSVPRNVAASQVVPGRFGGRPPKKKRKSGF